MILPLMSSTIAPSDGWTRSLFTCDFWQRWSTARESSCGAMKKTTQPRRARPSHVRRKSRLVLQIRPTISGDSLVSLPASRAVDRVHAACNDRLRSSRKVTWLGAVCAQASRLFIGASSSIPGQAPSQKKSANPVAGTPGIASACLSIISSTLLKDSCPSGAEAWYRAASPRVHVK